MDPKVCFEELCKALIAGESEVASDRAESLAEWISRGGFVPENLLRSGGLMCGKEERGGEKNF